jgi:hypothetical protein
MEETLDGIVTDIKTEPLNAPAPMEVTLGGIVMEVNLVQPLNAASPMEVTVEGIAYELPV